MAGGAIYSYLWLFLSFFVIFSRLRNTRFFYLASIAVCAFVGLWIPKAIVVAVINLFAGRSTHIGMPWGGPPLWPAFLSIVTGSALGWLAQKRNRLEARRSQLSGSPSLKRSKAKYERSYAMLLSIFFPGSGQVYGGALILGFVLLFGLSLATEMMKLFGFLTAYLFIQAATWVQRSLRSSAPQGEGKVSDRSKTAS